MTWTYTPDFTTSRDRIRLLIGDTLSADPLLTDEEIAQLYSTNGSDLTLAGIACCEALAARFARQVTHSIGQASIVASDLAAQFESLAKRLRMNVALGASAVPYLGGQSVADKEAVEANTDRVSPYFTRTTFDAPGNPSQSLTTTDDVLP